MNSITKMKYHHIMYLLYRLYNKGMINSIDDEIYDIIILIKKLIEAYHSVNRNIRYSTIVLKTIREVEDLTIDEFAKKCGFSKQFVSQMENETRPVSKKLIDKIQIIFNWPSSLFVQQEEKCIEKEIYNKENI